jgi:2-polyprenyl-3-methyl-5-hydroxy-6-metoxy-1,4-benzoquinol methylase
VLELTGERVIPKLMQPTNGMLLEHTARYYFATPYVKGRVLDMACGVGYGSHMVARICKKEITEIIGIDIDPETIDYAKKNYFNPRVHYQVEDVLHSELPRKLGKFETILSFETIEHIADDKTFMNNIRAMLHPGGTLVLSSPFGKGRGIPTSEPFHVHQYKEEEFKELFNGFSDVQFYFQKGVTFEPKRSDVHYPIGIAVCTM